MTLDTKESKKVIKEADTVWNNFCLKVEAIQKLLDARKLSDDPRYIKMRLIELQLVLAVVVNKMNYTEVLEQ